MKWVLFFFLIIFPMLLLAQSEEQDNADLAELTKQEAAVPAAGTKPPAPEQRKKMPIVRAEEAPVHEAALVTPTPPPTPTAASPSVPAAGAIALAKGASEKNIFARPDNADQLSLSEQVLVMIKGIKDVPDETIKDNLMGRLKDGEVKRFLINNPKVLTFLVRVLKDEKALPGLTKLAENKKKLAIFAGMMIATFILAMILKMPLRGNKDNKKALFPFYVRWPAIFILRIILFITYFQEEVGPTLKIAKELFF